MVDITRQLRHTLQLGRKDVTLKTLVIDANTDELIELDAESSKDTGIPLPELVGPWWRDASQLQEGDSSECTKAVQERLTVSGYYDGALDGEFGEKTLDALKAFQEINRLKSDGIDGASDPVLKQRSLAQGLGGAGISVYMSDSVVTYTVSDATPEDLSRQGVSMKSMMRLSPCGPLGVTACSSSEFGDSEEGPDADITVDWCGPRDVRFDGPGGGIWQRRIRSPRP